MAERIVALSDIPFIKNPVKYIFVFFSYNLCRQIFGKEGAPGDSYIRRIIDDGSSSESDTDRPGGSSSSVGDKRKATDFLVDEVRKV